MKKISYTKQMRDRAKVDGRHLVTVDVPGFTFQGPCSEEEAKEALEMVTRWLKAEARAEAEAKLQEHTPGPWNVTPKYFDEHGEALMQIECDSHMIGEIYVCDGAEGESNAQLIAKAPELLARCRELIDILWQYEWSVVHPLQPKLIELLDATRKTVQEVKSDRT